MNENETIDIHRFDRRLENTQNKIFSSLEINNANKNHIKKFIEYCFVSGMKKSSVVKDLYSLYFFASNTRHDLKKAKKDEFNRLIMLVENKKWTEWTKRNHRVAIKKFMKWLNGENKYYPLEVEEISTSRKRLSGFLPEDILTNEEVEKLINAADNIRDKSLVMCLAFLGGRIGEILNMKIKHVRFQDTGEVICMLIGKTGARTVVSIPLAPQLANYIENAHPNKDNPESFLWLTKHNMFSGRKEVGKRFSKKLNKEVPVFKAEYMPLTYAGAVKILHKLAENAKIQKRASPHWYRRYCATQDASYMSDRLMMLKYGWSSSEIVGIYSKLSSQSLIEAERKRHGRSTEGTKPKFSVVSCPRCNLDSPPTAKFCNKCGMVLSMESALKFEKMESISDELTTNQKNIKLFEEFIAWRQRKKN
jgi:site-specific recombinase XerD/ribosomal protein L40E